MPGSNPPKEPRYCLGDCDDFTDHKEITNDQGDVEVECVQCGRKGIAII